MWTRTAALAVALTVCSAAASPAAEVAGADASSNASRRPLPSLSPAAARAAHSELGRNLALIDTDPSRAAEALDAMRAKNALIDDVLLYYGAVARAGADPVLARARLEKLLASYPDSVLAGDAAALLAEIIEKQSDTEAAIALADRYGRGGASGPSSARVCLAAGRLLVTSSPGRAVAYLECARAKSPLSSNGKAAYDVLAQLREAHPELRPASAAALMDEARQLGREARSAEQIAMLDRLSSSFPDNPYGAEATLAYARALAASRGKSAAADYLEKRAPAADSVSRRARWLYEAATYRWNDNHDAEALLLFNRMIALHSGIDEEGEAYYAIARIHDAAGRRSDAIAAYETASTKARGATRVDSAWRQGWVSYRAKNWSDAERRFARMAAGATPGSDDDGRGEALYWRARSLEKLGRASDATSIFAQVLSEFPVGYYSLMAEKRLGRTQAVESRPLAPDTAAGSGDAQLPAAAQRALDRAELLDAAGLGSLAARDLAARLGAFDDGTKRNLMPALQRVGAYDAAFRIAADLQKNGKISREEARPYLYPKAHADIVVVEAGKAGIDPLLVYSLMRQESAFAAHVVSPASALGLMQLLQSTADRMAVGAGVAAPTREDLFEPSVNIRLGVRYLSELSRQFGGNTALMLAAYNAGENAAERWQPLTASYEEDEVIEQISYRETRAYVKSVLRNLRNYRRLYGSGPQVTSGPRG